MNKKGVKEMLKFLKMEVSGMIMFTLTESIKHGFARSTQHPHRLPLHHLQHLLRRNGMGSERHRMAHLFRCFRDDHHLRADRQMPGRKSERQYGKQHPPTDGNAAEDRPTGDLREDRRHQRLQDGGSADFHHSDRRHDRGKSRREDSGGWRGYPGREFHDSRCCLCR